MMQLLYKRSSWYFETLFTFLGCDKYGAMIESYQLRISSAQIIQFAS